MRTITAALIGFSLGLASPVIADWPCHGTNCTPEPAHEKELAHAFACGYAYARTGDHRNCPEFEAIEKAHGFK